MSILFTGTYEELKSKLSSLESEWDESQPQRKVLRKNGGVLNWFESTGRLQFQGKPGQKELLEKQVAYLLYPSEFEAPSQETVACADKEESESGLTLQAKSIELTHLIGGYAESEIIIHCSPIVGQRN